MAGLYIPTQPLHMISYQLEGRSDEKPEWTGVDPFWHGPAQQIPWGSRQGGRPFAQGTNRWLPDGVSIRASWNQFCFRDDPVEGWVLHSVYEDFLDELADAGRQFVWDWHDGRLSYLISKDKAPRWPMLYGLISTLEEATAGIEWLGEWADESYDIFLDWLSRRPKLQAATAGFELMNEPMAYNEAAKIAARTAGGSQAYFWGRKVDHIETMVGKLKAAYPTKFIIAPMAGANTAIGQYLQHTLPDRGGQNVLDAIRSVVGRDWMVWGMHRYPSFDRVARDLDEHKRLFIQDFRALNDDPVAVTEFNISGEWWLPLDRNPSESSKEWRSFFNGKYKDWVSADLYWPGKPEYWLTWWPFSNVSQNNIGNIYSNGDIGDHQRQSRAIWHAFFNRFGRDERLFGPLAGQRGHREPHIIDLAPSSAVRPDESDAYFDGWALNGMPAWQASANVDMALYWGGSYGTVHTILDGDYYSTVIGGDGKTVVLDDQNTAYRRNHYWLGKGGGVVRMGPGAHHVMSEGGSTRIYTCAGGYAAINLPYGWDNEIIIDPDVVKVWIFGFSRARGDKISFKNAFPTLQAMRAATTITESPKWIKNKDLTITLPNGGEVLFIHGGAEYGRLHETVLEWTDGWYAEGWSEPVNYTEADFDVLGPPAGPSFGGGSGVSCYDRDGQPMTGPFDRDGLQMTGPFDRDGRGMFSGED